MLRNAIRTSVKNRYTIGIDLNLLGDENLEKIPENMFEKNENDLFENTGKSGTGGNVGWDEVFEIYRIEEDRGGYVEYVAEAKRVVSLSRERYVHLYV
jgi:hypothetical protein